MLRSYSPLRRTLLTLLAIGGLSCVDGPTGPIIRGVVRVTPEALSLLPLDTATLAVTLSDGLVLSVPDLEWTSLDTLVARVDASGLVTASLYTGPDVRTTGVRVAHPRAAASTVPVEVRPWPVQRVVASVDSITLLPGDSALLGAVPQSSDDVPLEGRETLWLSSDTAAVQMLATGRLRARPYAGPLERTVFVSAWIGGVADSVVVRILPLPAASVVIAPAAVSVRPGQLDTLSAVVRSANAVTLVDVPITWTSSDTTVVRVNEEGVITASYYVGAAVRTASIIAAVGGVADTAQVEVQPLAAASLQLSAPDSSIFPVQAVLLEALVRDAAGLVLVDRPLVWSSLDPTVASVSTAGLATALAYGGPDTTTARIVASSAAAADTLTLTVLPHGAVWATATPGNLALQPLDTATVRVQLLSLNLDSLSGRTLSWISRDTTVATVEPSGRVTATLYTGPAVRGTDIVVTSEAAVDTIPVSVTPFAVARVIATPSTLALSPSDTARLSVTMEALGGRTLTERTRVWLSSDTTVVRVDTAGLVTAVPYTGAVAREAAVVVYSEGLADTVAITVGALPPASLTLAPDSVLLFPGQQSTLGSTVRSAGGITLEGVPLSWTSTDTLIARVNVEGIVTAAFYVGAETRSATVIASTGAVTDSAKVTVAPLAVASVQVSAPDSSITPTQALQLEAAVRDGAGLLLVDRPLAWSALDAAVASVNADGLVTALAYGGPDTLSARIVASTGGVADTLMLTVLPHAPAWATATPENLALQPFDTARVSVALASLNLDVLSNRPLVWATLDATIATVDAAGLVTATAYTGPAARSSAIVVTSGAAVDTVPVSVTPFAVERVVASRETLTLPPSDSATLGVSMETLGGLVLTGRAREWLSSDTTVVRVNADGLVSAVPYAGASDRSAAVVVYSEGLADTVAVTVLALAPVSLSVAPDSVSLVPGGQTTLAGTVLAAGDVPIEGLALAWSSADTLIARVNADGIVTASFYVGAETRSTLVMVGSGTLADTAKVVVTPLTEGSVQASAPDSSIAPGQAIQFEATVRDGAGLILTDRPLAWSTLDPAIASVSAGGLVTALAYGGPDTTTARIVVTTADAADTLLLTVLPHAPAWATATPENLALQPLDTATVSVQLSSLNLDPLTGRSVTWTSLNPAVAGVAASGLVTATAYTGPDVRSTSIVVSAGAAVDTVPVSVTPFAVERVIASRATLTLPPADTATVSVAMETLGGIVLSGRVREWLSSDTTVVRVNADGLVTAVPYAGASDRSAAVVVYSEGLADTVAVTVLALAPVSVTVAPDSVNLVPGQQTPLGSTVLSAGGLTLEGVPLTWIAGDTLIARVNADGIVTASFYVGAETRGTIVVASTGAVADTATVIVAPLAVGSVQASAPDSSIAPGQAIQLEAAVRDGAGLFLTDRPLTWSALDPAVATVSASGLVTAAVYGGPDTTTARIVVTAGGAADTLTLTVLPHAPAWATATPENLALQPLDTATVSVLLASLDLTPLTGRAVNWGTLDASVASVEPNGRVTATLYTGPAVRNTSVLVTSGAAVDTVPVSVTPFAVQRVVASRATLTLPPSDSATLSVSMETLGGVVLSGRAREWLSSDTSVITVDSTGRVIAVPYAGAGDRTAAVVVYSEGLADTVAVTVLALAPVSLTVAPDSVSLIPGGQTTLAGTVLAAGDVPIEGLALDWSSADTLVARVNAEGIVTASFYVGAATRSTLVLVGAGVLADTAKVVVTPLAVASVQASAPDSSIAPGQAIQLEATVRDGAGLFLTDRPLTWSTLDPAVAAVSASGLVTAAVYGGPDTTTARLVVTSASAADTLTLSILPHAAAWATATPENLALQPLDTATVSVLLSSLDLTPLTGRPVSWSALDATIASVEPNGRVTATLYTGPAVRNTIVLVTSGAAVDTVPVSVTPFAVERVVASLTTLSLAPSDTARVSVSMETLGGLVLSGRVREWLSSDTSVVQVDSTGLVTAMPYTGAADRSAAVVVYSEGLADTVAVTVLALAPASLTIAPDSVSLVPGQQTTLGSTVLAAGGITLDGVPLTWTSTDTSIARVNVEGVVTASFYVGAETRSTTVLVGAAALADTAKVVVAPLTAASVQLSAPDSSIAPTQTLQLEAAVRDGTGLLLVDRPLAWSALDLTVASVNADGLVTALAHGGPDTLSARIVASTGTVADTLTLTILPHAAAWATATPENLSLQPFDTARVTVALASLNLDVLSDRPLVWTALDATIATVDAAGLVTATAYTGPAVRGSAIVVTSGAAVDTVPVSVTPFAVERVIASRATLTLPPVDTATLGVRMETLGGLVLSDRAREWLSSDTTVVRVNADGLVTAVPYAGAGDRTAAVVVYSEGLADTVAVTVLALAPVSLTVAPDSVSLVPGAQTTLAGTVLAAGDVPIEGVALAWSAADTLVARVNADGIVTASFYVGAETRSTVVIVGTGALADTARIVVTPLAVASVQMSAPDSSIAPAQAIQLEATVRDGAGLFLTDRPLVWSSLDPAVATVSTSGLATALVYGGPDTRTARMVVTSASAADTLTLTIVPHSAAWATATPENLTLQPLDTARVTVALASLNLDVLSDRPLVWTALDAAIATVDTTGLVTATAYTGPAVRGSAIVVTSGAAVDTIPVTITPLAVAQVVAADDSITIASTDSVTLSATVQSADSTVLTGRELLWLSSDTALVQVSADGLAVAQLQTTATDVVTSLVVYSEGKADTVVVTITPHPPAAVVIAPDSISIEPGQTSPLTATVRTAADIALSGHTMTWASLDTTIARVNGDGVASGTFYVGPDARVTGIVATSGAFSDTALVRVRPLLPDSIAIFPDTQTLKPNETALLDAVVRDSAGLYLSGRTLTWTSSDTLVATVNDSGRVLTQSAGTVTITATSGSATDAATITVVHPVTSVVATPSLSTLWIGRTQTFSADYRDSTDATPPGRALRWTSSNPTVASVDSTGLVTALAPGLVTIVASIEGLADSVSIDVFAEPSAAITITFDDAWRGVLTYAAPMLDSLRLRANVAWITSVNWSGVMNPAELQQLQTRGWSIVSHSMTHDSLTTLPIDSAAFELAGSRARIDSLGFDPRVFVAPFLDYNDAVLAASAAAGYTYTRCCAQDSWSTDTLVQWPIAAGARHRLAGVDVTGYDGQTTTYNFRTPSGRAALSALLSDVVAGGKFVDVFFHDIVEADLPDLKLTLEILAGFRPYLITYAMLP